MEADLPLSPNQASPQYSNSHYPTSDNALKTDEPQLGQPVISQSLIAKQKDCSKEKDKFGLLEYPT